MSTPRTILLALHLLLAILPQGIETESPDPDPTIQILTNRHRDSVEWALGRFTTAGLQLPSLEITVHYEITEWRGRELPECKGFEGLYRNTGSAIVIHICAPRYGSMERTLLHELGHAWADATLTDDERAAFLDLRGLDAWNTGDWEERGFEHAAEILMWGLAAEPFKVGAIADTDTDTLTHAYRLLTGADPLHGGGNA